MKDDEKESNHRIRHEQASALKLKAGDQSVHHLLNAPKRPRSCEHRLDYLHLLRMDIHLVIVTHHAQVQVTVTLPSSPAIAKTITKQENVVTSPERMKKTTPPLARPIIAAIPHHTLALHPEKAQIQSVKLPHDLVEILLPIPHQEINLRRGTNLHRGINPRRDEKEIVYQREIGGIVEAGI